MISVDELAKGVDIKEGGDLDYKTPMGLQIKAKIEKGVPVKLEFFHDGERVEPKVLGKIDIGAAAHPREWRCFYVWWCCHPGPFGVMLPDIVYMCYPVVNTEKVS